MRSAFEVRFEMQGAAQCAAPWNCGAVRKLEGRTRAILFLEIRTAVYSYPLTRAWNPHQPQIALMPALGTFIACEMIRLWMRHFADQHPYPDVPFSADRTRDMARYSDTSRSAAICRDISPCLTVTARYNRKIFRLRRAKSEFCTNVFSPAGAAHR